jgi:hypothetical protein
VTIQKLNIGDKFHGYQQYVRIHYIYVDPDFGGRMVMMYIRTGECHRMVHAEYYVALALLNQMFDETYDGELEQDVELAAVWPDDVDYDEYKHTCTTRRTDALVIYDRLTGEIYDEIEQGDEL